MATSEPMANWITPNSVMKNRKLKQRRSALKARLSGSPVQFRPCPVNNSRRSSLNLPHQRNPFLKTSAEANLNISNEDENDSLNLLLNTQYSESADKPSSFENILQKNVHNIFEKKKNSQYRVCDSLFPDWSLKNKMRICSRVPLPWKHTFKTSEEASGTTGFVRCLNSPCESSVERTLDTSSNARFYQCCLYWQSPSLPLLSLFPRNKKLKSSNNSGGIYGSDPNVAAALHFEWGESLRSLYQLLRVRQCPYFYMCAPTFTCLFRAAGIAGFTHTHALITPTTKGFRKMLKNEGIEFSLPLMEKSQNGPDDSLEDADEGGGQDDEEEPSDFLETLGLETSQFPTLNQSRSKTEKVQNVDKFPESLVFVEDMELQGLINFFLNCNSCVSVSGSLAGVPPTLLAHVAFHGATLKSLKVNSSTIKTSNGTSMYSIDIQGPLLPTTVVQLSSLLSLSQESYSMSFAQLPDTLPFCSVSPSVSGSEIPMAFATEGLIDSGLEEGVRRAVCVSSDGDGENESSQSRSYREVKFSAGKFTCFSKPPEK